MDVKLIPGTLPPNYCITDLQAFYQLIFSLGYGTLDTTASIAKVIIGATEPTADQQDYVWIRLNPVSGVFDKIYNYVNGGWKSPHPVPPAPVSHERRFWAGSLESLHVYDGGSVAQVGDAIGPFWQEDTEMRGLFPLGAGTLASGTIIGPGSTGGADTLTLSKANLPAEPLVVNLDIIGLASSGTAGQPVIGTAYGATAIAGEGRAVDATTNEFTGRYKPKGVTEAMGSGTALNLLPPYYGGYWIKRTKRRYYTPS